MYSDPDNVPFYIGKGSEERYRLCKHEFGRSHTANKIKSICVKNVKVYFLYKNLSEEEAFKYEKYYINVFGRKDNGTGILTNHTDGGDGMSGNVRSEETKKKIGDAFRGKKLGPLSEEHKRNISESHKGIKHSEETKRKMRGRIAWNKGIPQTKEAKQKQEATWANRRKEI